MAKDIEASVESVEKNPPVYHVSDVPTSPSETLSLSESQMQNTHLKKRFNIWTTLAMVYSLTAVPIGMGDYMTFSIGLGSASYYIWGFLFCGTMNLLICISLAEMAAMFPHILGQVYWTSVLVHGKWKRPLTYCNLVATWSAWMFWLISTTLLTADILWAAVLVCFEDFVLHPWHVYVVFVACCPIFVALNIPLLRAYTSITKAFVFIVNFAVLFIFIVLLVRSPRKLSGHELFVKIANDSGWSSKELVFFLSLLPGTTAINGFDAASHMSEELPDPAKNVPRVMLANSGIGIITGFVSCIIYMVCNTQPNKLLDSVAGIPIVQLIWDESSSKAYAVASAVFILLIIIYSTSALTLTCSRILLAAARIKAFPFSRHLQKIDPRFESPSNAIYACIGITILVGLLQLGPSTALAALGATAIVYFYISYGIAIALFIQFRWREKSSAVMESCHRKPGTFGLPRLISLANSIGALLWSVMISVFLMFPYYQPVTTSNMNYCAAVVGVVAILMGVGWFAHARWHFELPKEDS